MWFLQSGTEEVKLVKGNIIKLTLDDKFKDNCDDKTLWLDYKNITKVVQQGSHIYVDDGLISLKVKEIGEFKVKVEFKKFQLILMLCYILKMFCFLTHDKSDTSRQDCQKSMREHFLIFQVLIFLTARLRTEACWAARKA